MVDCSLQPALGSVLGSTAALWAVAAGSWQWPLVNLLFVPPSKQALGLCYVLKVGLCPPERKSAEHCLQMVLQFGISGPALVSVGLALGLVVDLTSLTSPAAGNLAWQA